jgi:hypothetical protein
MNNRQRLFRTSSEKDRSENPGFSYFSFIESIKNNQEHETDKDATTENEDEKYNQLLLRSRQRLIPHTDN